jgi:hypothetical protein
MICKGKCKKDKPLSEFYKRKKTGVHDTTCKKCRQAYSRGKYDKNTPKKLSKTYKEKRDKFRKEFNKTEPSLVDKEMYRNSLVRRVM